MKIAILASTQWHNPYICAKTTEAETMGHLARLVVDTLNHYGAPSTEAKLFWDASGEDTYVKRADAAKAWGAELAVSLHSDAAGDQPGLTGSVGLCSPLNSTGCVLASSIQKHLQVIGLPSRGQRTRTDLYVLNRLTHIPSTLVEVANHQDPDDCRFVISHLQEMAEAVAKGIFEYLGIRPKTDKGKEEDERMKPFLVQIDDGAPGQEDDAIWHADPYGLVLTLLDPEGEKYFRENLGLPIIGEDGNYSPQAASAFKQFTRKAP